MGMGGGGASTKRRGEYSLLRCEQPQSPPHLHQPPTPPREFSTILFRAILMAVTICLIYILLNESHSYAKSPSSQHHSSFHIFKSDDLPPQDENERDKLEPILEKASMKEEKTVIITTVNAAWTENSSIFDLFLESMKIGDQTEKLIENLVVVALDQEAYSRCRRLHRHCFALSTVGVDFSGEKRFMSGDYLKMMWRRIDFLRSVLEMGYSFIFSDADIAWMRDPFERLYKDGDVQIACDVYLFNSTNRHNHPNGGFIYVKSNSRTVQFYKYWYAKRDSFPGSHDQDVFNKIKFDPFINDIELDIRFLDTTYFSGFCDPNEDLDVVVTMHANCCTKLKSKIHDIKMVIDDWKRYKMGKIRSWTLPRLCGVNSTKLERMKALAHASFIIKNTISINY